MNFAKIEISVSLNNQEIIFIFAFWAKLPLLSLKPTQWIVKQLFRKLKMIFNFAWLLIPSFSCQNEVHSQIQQTPQYSTKGFFFFFPYYFP
jgi:hypothetical protein